MKSVVGSILLFIFITGCSKKEEHTLISNGLVGKWKFTEYFMSPGGQGSWNLVPVSDQYIINFSSDGKLSYTTNFYWANSLFNRYRLAGDTIFVSSTWNNKTDEWRYSFEGPQLIINFNVRVVCIEGCASRFIEVK